VLPYFTVRVLRSSVVAEPCHFCGHASQGRTGRSLSKTPDYVTPHTDKCVSSIVCLVTLPYTLRSCSTLVGRVTSLLLAAYVLQFPNYTAWRGFRLPPRSNEIYVLLGIYASQIGSLFPTFRTTN
jgi:hypothetical protein